MSFAILINTNYKKYNLAQIYRHIERKQDTYFNKEIDKKKSYLNYSLKEPKEAYLDFVKRKIKENNIEFKQRSNSVYACEYVMTSDKTFFKSIGKKETERYFRVCYNFVKNYKNLGDEYIISAKVHMDETTPHMHIVFMPILHLKRENEEKFEKLCCFQFFKGRNAYRVLQNAFYKCVIDAGFDLERGKSLAVRKLSVPEFKKITCYEEMKKELEFPMYQEIDDEKVISPFEFNSLVKILNKYKLYFNRSLISVEEAIELKRQNEKLRDKYIEEFGKNKKMTNSFEEVVKVLNEEYDIRIEEVFEKVKNTQNNLLQMK